ncbi:MAG: SprT family zinc-dependent metalloprotease [Candidatus Margulisiibacteriota bacterium]
MICYHLVMAFSYQLKRSGRRRSIGITIDPHKGVVVAAPKWVGKSEIVKVLRDKQGWIESKLAYFASREWPKPKEFKPGEKLLFLGKEHTLSQGGHLPKGVYLRAEEILVATGGQETGIINRKRLIREWYINEAKRLIVARLELYAARMRLFPGKVAIKEHRRQWGSCSRRGSINFNWKLIMAPIEVIDYVVVHELSHLCHLDHSCHFWAKVSSVIPDHKQRRAWLRKNSLRLQF